MYSLCRNILLCNSIGFDLTYHSKSFVLSISIPSWDVNASDDTLKHEKGSKMEIFRYTMMNKPDQVKNTTHNDGCCGEES